MTRDDYNMSSPDDPMLEDGTRVNGKKYDGEPGARNKTIGQKVSITYYKIPKGESGGSPEKLCTCVPDFETHYGLSKFYL